MTPEDAEPAFAAFIAEHETIRAAVAERDLDDTFVYGKARRERNLRWVYVATPT